ncbi:MAG: DNA-directed RNA polymerase [Syntrophobacteraceae bacterium]
MQLTWYLGKLLGMCISTLQTSSSGFVAVQRYVETKVVKISSVAGPQRIQIGFYKDTQKVDSSKTRAGISPNVIHSFDAAHLVNTVAQCHRDGVHSFSMIHDSYGCHAGNMDKLQNTL